MYFVCCQILGVNPGADEETIKSAYRKSAKELHPDINDSDKAQEYFVILKNAYEYLLTHRYNEQEIKALWHQEQVKKGAAERRKGNGIRSGSGVRPSTAERYTLREVLKHSRLARTMFLVFHALFIFVGIWILFHSIYDLILREPKEGTNVISAYFTVVFGFVMGLLMTSIFLFTGISYLRDR